MTQHCTGCDRILPLEAFYADRSKPRGVHSRCRRCVLAKRSRDYWSDKPKFQARFKAYYQAHRDEFYRRYRGLRQRVLDAYGHACQCCGETTPEFLAIDHVHNNGARHRQELRGYNRSIYQWLAAEGFPQDGRFQLLCHNCNTAKGLYGGCPHQGAVPGRRRKAA